MAFAGFVILSNKDSVPLLPAVATVSKDDPNDDGGYAYAVAARAPGRIVVDRPYWTGNPSPAWLVDKCKRNDAVGLLTQAGNEQNHPDEGWQGGAPAWRDFWREINWLHPGGKWLSMPPSPGFPNWQEWIVDAERIAVHAYGTFGQMQEIVQWYLDNTRGDLYITECNPGAGNAFDLNQWASTDFVAFLAWCDRQPRVKFVAYFAYRWDYSPKLPSSVDGAGTFVQQLLVARGNRKVEEPVADKLRDMLAAEFGNDFVDLRAKLPPRVVDGREQMYALRPVNAINAIAVHHTGHNTNRTTTWEAINSFHINSNGWPGTGYTFGVRDQQGQPSVAYLEDITSVTYHVGDANTRTLGIVVANNFVGPMQPSGHELLTLIRLVAVIDAFLGRQNPIHPHRYFMAERTCPENLTAHVGSLRPHKVKDGIWVHVDDPVFQWATLIKTYADRFDTKHWKDPFGNVMTRDRFRLWCAAIMRQESNGNPNARGKWAGPTGLNMGCNEQGLYQIVTDECDPEYKGRPTRAQASQGEFNIKWGIQHIYDRAMSRGGILEGLKSFNGGQPVEPYLEHYKRYLQAIPPDEPPPPSLGLANLGPGFVTAAKKLGLTPATDEVDLYNEPVGVGKVADRWSIAGFKDGTVFLYHPAIGVIQVPGKVVS